MSDCAGARQVLLILRFGANCCKAIQLDGDHGIDGSSLRQVQATPAFHRLLAEQDGSAQPPAGRRGVPTASAGGDMQRSRARASALGLGDPAQRRCRSCGGSSRGVAYDSASRSGSPTPLSVLLIFSQSVAHRLYDAARIPAASQHTRGSCAVLCRSSWPQRKPGSCHGSP